MGIAFGGFKERTKQAIAEDKRKGKKLSDDDDERPRRKGHGRGKSEAPGDGERSGAWKRKSKPKKVAVEYKTYEEIVQQAGLDASIPHQPGVGPIIDATGATPKEVSSIAALSASWTNSTDTMRIPEIRHNLRLMVDMTKQDVLGLAREGKLLEEKRKKSAREEARLSKKIKKEAELIRRLEDMKITIDELAGVAKSTQESLKAQDYTDYETNVSHKSSALDPLSQYVERFMRDFTSEYELYRVDEVLVGAMAPILRLELASWDPLDEPDRWTSVLKRWKGALKMRVREEEVEELALSTFYGVSATKRPINQEVQVMTPWEALLWNAWLPKVRSAIKYVRLLLFKPLLTKLIVMNGIQQILRRLWHSMRLGMTSYRLLFKTIFSIKFFYRKYNERFQRGSRHLDRRYSLSSFLGCLMWDCVWRSSLKRLGGKFEVHSELSTLVMEYRMILWLGNRLVSASCYRIYYGD